MKPFFIRNVTVTVHLINVWLFYPSVVWYSQTRLTRTPHYLEHVLSVIYYGLSRTRLSQTPHYLEPFLAPLSSNQPRLSWTLLHSKETLVNSSQKVQSLAPRDKMYWKLRKCIGVFTVKKAKPDWLDFPLRMQKGTSCHYLLISGIKLLLQKFDVNLAISNPRYLELFFDSLE